MFRVRKDYSILTIKENKKQTKKTEFLISFQRPSTQKMTFVDNTFFPIN